MEGNKFFSQLRWEAITNNGGLGGLPFYFLCFMEFTIPYRRKYMEAWHIWWDSVSLKLRLTWWVDVIKLRFGIPDT